MDQNIKIKYNINSIDIIEFNVKSDSENTLAKNTGFTFEISIRHEYQLEENLFRVMPTINISTDQEKVQLGHIVTGIVFYIENLKSYFIPETEKFEFPNGFMELLHSISLSTNRGVMFTIFRNTHIHKAILPIIDMKKFEEQKN
jgi:hypothetical protein